MQDYTSHYACLITLNWQEILYRVEQTYILYIIADNFDRMIACSYSYSDSVKCMISVVFLWIFFLMIFRLTPVVGFSMLFWVYVVPHLATGPQWYTMTYDATCAAHWWSNLLYIQNFFPVSLEQIVSNRSILSTIFAVISAPGAYKII